MPYEASVIIGGTTLSVGLILVIITVILLVMIGRSENGSVLWFIAALILGVLLAASFPVLAADINNFFRSL
jgi:hypothetical protein